MAAQPVTLTGSRDVLGRVLLSSVGPTSSVHTIETSPDLRTWREIARTHDGWDRFPVTPESDRAAGYFRASVRPRTTDDDWKNQLLIPGDRLFASGVAEGTSGTRWVKFTMPLEEPGRVYFQDGLRFPFHHAFAAARLAGFERISPEEFDAVSLRTNRQRLVLGAVLLPVDSSVREIGLQIVGREPFPGPLVIAWLRQVRDALSLPAGWTPYYLPAYEQGSPSSEEVDALVAAGFRVGTPARWVQGDEAYSLGWAYGRLKYVRGGDIGSAYAAGILRHSDILLTDVVPAEIPLLAGCLSLSPATPSSHVAILSQSFGAPFAYLADGVRQEELRGWDGQELIVRVERTATGSRVHYVNVENALTATQKQALLAAKSPSALAIVPMAARGAIYVPAAGLTSDDVRYVGGKAANFGTLLRALPQSTPGPALAFTFDLWNGFLDQRRPDGRTLRESIDERLAGHAFPPDMARLSQDLAAVRSMVRDESDFSAAQKTEILGALSVFPPGRKVRFRSSTNVEDTEQFSGAGLYDSYSGCPDDDLDADGSGPSGCDPEESAERGVFRALRRVYASFFNDNAFVQRLRYRVDARSTGMAVLVHPSFPDPEELANGVATLRIQRPDATSPISYSAELVSQLGAVSITNPQDNARPEVVTMAQPGPGLPTLTVERRSSLVPLGGLVLPTAAGYQELFGLLKRAADEHLSGKPERLPRVLDLEYKRVAPGHLMLKQIREVPVASSSNQPAPFELSDAGRLEVFQHHGKDLNANHRLKSVWDFQSLVFQDGPVLGGLDPFVRVARHDGAQVRHFAGRMSTLPGAQFTRTDKTLTYQWVWTEGRLAGRYRLTAKFETALKPDRPVLLGSATLVELAATYDTPQVSFDMSGTMTRVATESTRLVPLSVLTEGSLSRKLSARGRGVSVEGDYTLSFLKFGDPRVGIFDTKSFPLVKWRGFTFSGLTPTPFRLEGTFSQTYDSGRHNFSETFLFQPGLEPGLGPEILAALRDADVKAVRVSYSQFSFSGEGPESEIQLIGFDDRLRPLP